MPQERPYPPPTTLEAVAQRAKDLTLIHGEHPTTLMLEGERQMITTLLSEVAPTHEQRLLQLYAAGRLLAEQNIIGVLQQVFFISEAWVRKLHNAPPDVPMRNLPRTEALIVSQMVLQPRATKLVVYEMKRTSKGRLTSLENLPELGEQSLTAHSPLLEMVALGFLGSAPPTK